MKKSFLGLMFIPSLILPGLLFKCGVSREVAATVPQYNIPIEAGEELDYTNEIYDGFDNGIDYDSWYLNKRAWSGDGSNGRYHGGVNAQNVFYDSTEGTAILRTTGDYYTGRDIASVPGAGRKDGTRTGADLVSKFRTYPGRYEVRMKIAPRYGVCTTMWTYIEYKDANNEAQNHEIDIELPYQGNMKKVSFGHYSSLSKHSSKKVTFDNPFNDGEFHTYGFDWYYNDTTGKKMINYYIDGVIYYTSSDNVPFYGTKLNIGIWVPDSSLAGTPPRYDTAYADIDYFRYIPFKNHHHEDSPYTSSYHMSSVATQSEYPSVSTHLTSDKRNYFPNGSFNFVNTLNSDEWYESLKTGQVTNNVTYAKVYDHQSSSTSGGASISSVNGSLAGYVDSCYFGQTYHLSNKYKNGGKVSVKFFDANDEEIGTQTYNLENSETWTDFDKDIQVIPNTAYLSVNYFTNGTALLVDDIYLTLGAKSTPEVDNRNNHFMSIFHQNPAVLSVFGTDGSYTSSKKTDLVLNNMDLTSDVSWRISIGKYEYKAADYVNSITMGSSTNNIGTSEDATYSSIIAATTNEGLSGIQSVIHSTSPIENIRNISLSWSSVEAGRVYVVYKLVGETNWRFLKSFGALEANQGSDNKDAWNRRQLIIDNSDETFVNNLLGQNAYIGFMFSSNHGNAEVSYIRLQAIIINKIEAIKAKIDRWSENGINLCGASGSLFDDKSQDYFDLLMTNYGFNLAQANDLNTEMSIEGSAKEQTYYDQYAYLCNIAGISVSVLPTNSLLNSTVTTNSGLIMVVVSAMCISLAMIASIVIIKKKYRR